MKKLEDDKKRWIKYEEYLINSFALCTNPTGIKYYGSKHRQAMKNLFKIRTRQTEIEQKNNYIQNK